MKKNNTERDIGITLMCLSIVISVAEYGWGALLLCFMFGVGLLMANKYRIK